MRIRQPGKIRDNLWLLGKEESCVYLLEGNAQSMIISGGMSYIVPDLLQQFEIFGINEARIKKLLILHAHFDHVGIVLFLKASTRNWKSMRQSAPGNFFHSRKPSIPSTNLAGISLNVCE